MEDVSKNEGRTVLFVSHNIIAIKNLCNKGMLLENGQITLNGESNIVLEYYMNTQTNNTSSVYLNKFEKPFPHITNVEVKIIGSQPKLNLSLLFSVNSKSTQNKGLVVVDIFDKLGICVYQIIPEYSAFIPVDGKQHNYKIDIEIPGLKPGTYDVSLWFGPDFKNQYEWLNKFISFQIDDSPEKNRTMAYVASEGIIVPKNHISKYE